MRSIARLMVATLVLMGQARRSRALRSVCPTLRMVSSFGGGSGSGSSGGIGSGASGARSFQRDPTKVLEQGRIIAEDALSIAQEVGFGATLRRTIRAQQALLSTAVELSRELPLSAPPSPSSFPPSAATPQALVESYLETLPPELAQHLGESARAATLTSDSESERQSSRQSSGQLSSRGTRAPRPGPSPRRPSCIKSQRQGLIER